VKWLKWVVKLANRPDGRRWCNSVANVVVTLVVNWVIKSLWQWVNSVVKWAKSVVKRVNSVVKLSDGAGAREYIIEYRHLLSCTRTCWREWKAKVAKGLLFFNFFCVRRRRRRRCEWRALVS
jgi:hypothetical protein